MVVETRIRKHRLAAPAGTFADLDHSFHEIVCLSIRKGADDPEEWRYASDSPRLPRLEIPAITVEVSGGS
jgi:hypothetical protein